MFPANMLNCITSYYREDENSETYYLKDNWATISPIITDWTDRSKL